MGALHGPEALRALSEAEDVAVSSWARARLVLVFGEVAGMPALLGDAEPVLASGADGVLEALVARIRGGDASADTMCAAEAVRACGIPDADVVDALASVAPIDPEAAMWRTITLARAGRPDPAGLAVAANVRAPHDGWPLATAVLWVAHHLGDLEGVADAVARGIRTEDLWPAVHALGGAPLPSRSVDPAEDVRLGRAVACGDGGALVRFGKGGRQRRLSAVVQGVLDGVPGPAAALLRAMARAGRLGVDEAWCATTAGWLSAFRPGDDPVGDVIERAGAAWPGLLGVARAGVVPEDRDRLIAALVDQADAAPLVLPILDDELVAHLFERVYRAPDLRTVAVAAVAAARRPEALVPYLERGPSAGTLALAAFSPHEDVLIRLLTTTSITPETRAGWAWALGSMGDPAAYAMLEGLSERDDDPALRDALQLCGRILGLA